MLQVKRPGGGAAIFADRALGRPASSSCFGHRPQPPSRAAQVAPREPNANPRQERHAPLREPLAIVWVGGHDRPLGPPRHVDLHTHRTRADPVLAWVSARPPQSDSVARKHGDPPPPRASPCQRGLTEAADPGVSMC